MAEALERLLIGRTLAGRYEVGEVIGRGGMSVVYRGVDQTLGRPVAVKLISLPSASEDMRANLRERFRREAGSAASIPHHPNVVQIYDYGTDPELDLDFIVMELLVGRDLKEALSGRPPTRDEAVRILREAARGLSAGHRVGLVHRDVKPANLFLAGADRFESVRVLDFGIAKPLAGGQGEDLTLAGHLPHSPAYASPEQVDPARPVTPASDVYQLGLIGYELLSGERPFDDDGRARIRAGEDVPVRGGPAWEAVPAPLREMVLRALRPRPEDRYPDAAEFAEALSAAAEDERTLAADAAPPRYADDATVAAPPRPEPARAAPPPQPAAPQPAQPQPAPPRPAPAPRPARAGGGGRIAMIAGGLLLLALVAWGISRMGGGGEPADPGRPAATEPADTGATAREFEGLEREAARKEAQGPGAAPKGGTAPAPPPQDEEAGRAAAVEVQRTVAALNETWVRGEMDRHLAHYADRVDFYGTSAPRSRVREERERDLRTFNRNREIRIVRQAVTFPSPARAVALVDKEWDFEGDRLRRSGAGRQEMILERRDGRWVVVSERLVETYRSSQKPR